MRWIHSITLGCIIIGICYFSGGEKEHLQGKQNCRNFSQMTTRTSFFLWVTLSSWWRGGKIEHKIQSPKAENLRSFSSFFLPRWPLGLLKLCSRCTQHDSFFWYSSDTSLRPAIKHPRTPNIVLPCHWRWNDTGTDEHLAADWMQSDPAGKVRQSVMESLGIKLPLCRFMLIKWANELSRVSRWVPGYALMYLVPLLTVNCLHGEMMEWCFFSSFLFSSGQMLHVIHANYKIFHEISIIIKNLNIWMLTAQSFAFEH